jgi:hypothetical protein
MPRPRSSWRGGNQAAHADAAGFDNRKVAGPVVARRDKIGKSSPRLSGSSRWNPEQDYTGRRRCGISDKFAKILVEREENAVFPHGPSQDIQIALTRGFESYPDDVMTHYLESRDRRSREIFVCEEAHSSRGRVDFLGAQHASRVCQTRNDIFMRYSRIIFQDIGFRPAVRHQSDHELDRQPATIYDRFSGQNSLIDDYPRLIRHLFVIPGYGFLSNVAGGSQPAQAEADGGQR